MQLPEVVRYAKAMNLWEQVKKSANLRECPFCGSPATYVNGDEVRCTSCHASINRYLVYGNLHDKIKGNPLTISELWNRRDKQSAAATLMGLKGLAKGKNDDSRNT